jgi:hypothetical protein
MRVRASLTILLAALTTIAACEEDAVTPPPEKQPTWWLEPNSMNLGILVLDYLSYEFEGGRVDHYAPCDSCDRDSLPFEQIYEPPLDVGSVTFRYTETAETLLFASVIFMGNGTIKIPHEFLSPLEFRSVTTRPDSPLSVEYFDNVGRDEPSAEADTAWSRVRCLDVVKEFATLPYRVGIYWHNSGSGPTNPPPDSWVIFLYRGRLKP